MVVHGFAVLVVSVGRWWLSVGVGEMTGCGLGREVVREMTSSSLPVPPVPWTAAQLEQISAVQRAEAAGYARRAQLLVAMSAGCDDRESGWAGDVPLGSLLLEVAGSAIVHQNVVGGWLADAQHLVRRRRR